jgi:Flp pilus assembly protein TadG
LGFQSQNLNGLRRMVRQPMSGIPPGWGNTIMPLTRLRTESARAFARFSKDLRAGVAPLLGIAFVPMMGLVGAAVDYSRANAVRTSMQGALDAAALSLVRQNLSGNALTQSADAYFNANFDRTGVQNIQVSASSSTVSGGNAVTMSATGSVATTVLRVIGFSNIPITTGSTVVAKADGLGCVLSLNRSVSAAIAGQGSTTVDLRGCSLYDNSANTAALTVGGSASVSALSVGVVGGISGGSGLHASQGIYTGIGPVTDPYANDSFPTPGACTETNFKPKDPVTISPGVYCGGMNLNAGVAVTLSPGIYYIDGGDLTVNGGATLTGTGVTLVFTKHNRNDWPTATINGNANINLTAPQSGPTAGIVVFGDRQMPVGTSFKLNGGSTQYLGGAVYIPQGAVEYAGGAATSTSCTQIIGDTVSFVGNSSVAINCSSYKTKPFSSWSVRVAS